MKTSTKLMIGMAFAMSASSAFAQHPKDEVQCANELTVRDNFSIFSEDAKGKRYADAFESWKFVYQEAPDYHKNLYIEGEKMFQNMINECVKAKNNEKRIELTNMMMEMYDSRIKYYGDDAKMPAAKILGNKAINYLSYLGGKADLDTAYTWLSSSVMDLKDDADAKVLVKWVDVSLKKYQKNPEFKSDYINNYMKGSEYMDGSLNNWYTRLERDIKALHDDSADNDAKAAKDSVTCDQFIAFIKNQKIVLTNSFGNSGAADVETIVSVFEPQIEEKKEDGAFLNNVTKLLRRTKGGKDTDLYFKVSEYSYNLAPSQESAKGMSDLSIRNKDWDNAIKYLEESFGFAVQPEDKADVLCMEAYVYYKFKDNFSKARELCRQAASLDKTNAESHMYIGEMYMQSLKRCGEDDPILSRLVFVAAADEFAKGKAADANRAADFQARISQCKGQFPEKSQLFMKGLNPGNTYHIGGWMNINVVIPD